MNPRDGAGISRKIPTRFPISENGYHMVRAARAGHSAS